MGRRAGKLLGSRLRGVAWIHAHMDKLCEARQVDQPIAVDVCACEEAAALLGGEHGVIKRAPEIFELLKADGAFAGDVDCVPSPAMSDGPPLAEGPDGSDGAEARAEGLRALLDLGTILIAVLIRAYRHPGRLLCQLL